MVCAPYIKVIDNILAVVSIVVPSKMKSIFTVTILGLFCLGPVLSQDDSGCQSSGMLPYDYSEALCKSILFYDAQRSGALNGEDRFDWRGDSCLTDGADNGVDLVGGYFDAGDFVKFGLPMAYTVTLLAWSLHAYPDGYNTAGQTDYALAAIKWGSDYLLKANTGPTELWGQVGDGGTDHAYWGRPEDLTMARPSDKIDATAPGSDLAGETAAALAASAVVFSSVDPAYSAQCLAAAINLFDFADQYRDFYYNGIQGASGYYLSSSWQDELPWAALWLYKATGDQTYLTRGKDLTDEFGFLNEQSGWTHNFDWDDKKAGVYALLAELDGGTVYIEVLQNYTIYLRTQQQTTPLGLVYIMMWGSLRHANNVAFITLRASELGIDSTENIAFAKTQIDYTLGSTGRSYMCGFGVNPPVQPHHRSASCPYPPDTCDWAQNSSPDPNPHVLYGAMVGGPDENDAYTDNRNDYIHNEVADDYNAALTGVLAYFVQNN